MQISSGFKLDVFYNGEVIDLSDDRRTVHQFGLRDKMVRLKNVIQSQVIIQTFGVFHNSYADWD